MANVTRDSHGTTLDNNAVASPVNYSGLTIGAQSNLALVVEINWAVAKAGVTLTWDSGGTNQALTLIKTFTSASGYVSELWGLIAPTQGNKTLQIAWSAGTAAFVVAATSYFNVDQTGGVTTFYGTATGNGTTTASVVLASATGDMTISSMSASTGTGTTNQTLLYFLSGAGTENGGASEAVGAASVTHTWTVDAGIVCGAVGCSIKAFAAAAGFAGLLSIPLTLIIV